MFDMRRSYVPTAILAMATAVISACGYLPLPQEGPKDDSNKTTAKSGLEVMLDAGDPIMDVLSPAVIAASMEYRIQNMSNPANDANKMVSFTLPAGYDQGITTAYEDSSFQEPGTINQNSTMFNATTPFGIFPKNNIFIPGIL